MSRTWSQWLGIDEQSKAEAKARKEQETKEKQAKAVEDLRALFDSEEGRNCMNQMAQGGEFGRYGRPEDAITDAFLRRWLVARDWQVDVTYKLLMGQGAWRHRTMPKGYVEEHLVQRPLDDNKTFLQGVDHQGRALVIVQVRNHFTKKRCLKQMKLFSAYIMESLVALCDKERNPGTRVVAMFDFTNSSIGNMDATCMSNIIMMLSNHYVERLSAMYFYNPPAVFWVCWNGGKHLLPEVTSRKILVIDPSNLSEIRAAVPMDVLPIEYGGQAPLRPIDQAIRHFNLPPFDGRLTEDAIVAASVASAAAAATTVSEDDELLSAAGSSGEVVEAQIVFSGRDSLTGGPKEGLEAGVAGAEAALEALSLAPAAPAVAAV